CPRSRDARWLGSRARRARASGNSSRLPAPIRPGLRAPRRPLHRSPPRLGSLARRVRADVAEPRIPFRVPPMLATLVSEPFHRPGFVYEEKYDGYRILAYKEGRRVTLLTRNLKDRTADFPEIAHAVGTLRAPTLLLDGEIAIFDA